MRNLLCIILLFTGISAFGQAVEITGRINDSVSKEIIPYVNIMIDGTSYGCSSDSTGYFSLIVPHLPVDVTVSHIFYKTKHIHVRSRRDLRRIVLTPHVYLLDEATVKPIVNITRGLLFDIVDYEFWGDSILLSGYCYKYPKEQNPWLMTINDSGDTLNRQIIGTEGSFFPDCLGNVHYLTNSFAYQLYPVADSFTFVNVEPREHFEEVMFPCMFETENELIFQTYAARNQIINYFAVDKESKEFRNILSVDDPVGLNMLSGMGRFHNMSNNQPTEADLRFEEMCFFDSIYSPVFKIRDSVYFFDLMNDNILCFDQNFELARKCHCTLHHFKDFKEKIIIDEPSGKAYALYQRTGFTYIREVSLDNGQMLESYTIPNYQWIDKIRVHNEQLFFLYREKFTGDLISLYRMRLEENY
jgi:hypothetical protein